MVIKDKVISGISGGEFGVRGFVTANDVNTGKQVWRMYSTGPEAEVGFPGSVETWKGEEWKRGGGTTWGWYSYDPELDLFYYGTGNPGLVESRSAAGRQQVLDDDLRAQSRHRARRRGRTRRHRTMRGTTTASTRTCWSISSIGGQTRKVLVNFDRNGFSYVLDRKTGELLQAEPFVFVNWAKSIDLKTGRPVEDPEKRTSATKNTKDICPSAMGGKNQQPVSYSPRTGYFYVPTNNLCMDYEGVEVKYQAGQPYVGAIVVSKPGPGGNRGEFIAWDPQAGKKVWGIKEELSAWGGALATGGDVVFYGTMEGWLKAVDAKTRRRAVEVQDAIRHHRQPDDLRRSGRQAVRGGALRHRRMVGHRRRRGHGARGPDGRSRRHRRVRRSGELQQPGWRADGVRAAMVRRPMGRMRTDRLHACWSPARCCRGGCVVVRGAPSDRRRRAPTRAGAVPRLRGSREHAVLEPAGWKGSRTRSPL